MDPFPDPPHPHCHLCAGVFGACPQVRHAKYTRCCERDSRWDMMSETRWLVRVGPWRMVEWGPAAMKEAGGG